MHLTTRLHPVTAFRHLIATAMCVFAAVGIASAQTPTTMSAYNFQYLTGGTMSDMSSSTALIGSSVDDGRSSLQNIGFTFNFGGTNYTQYSVSSNGLMAFGSTLVSTSFSISLTITPQPWITAMAVDQYTRGNGVRSKVFGTSPNRSLVVQWDVYRYATSTSTALYEVRLFEGTNEIQFVYGASNTSVTNWASRIGLVASSSNFVLVNSSSNTTTTSDITASTFTFPTEGKIYRFFACSQNVRIDGNVSQGAQTTAMANGASILSGFSVQQGSSAIYNPFTITNPADACGTRNFSYSISGPAAADYQILPGNGTLAATQANTPSLMFAPRGNGVRTATLIVTDDGSPAFARSYTLSGTGTPRFIVTGNISQGGTSSMASGDTLFAATEQFHGSCSDFTPFSMSNTNLSPSATPLDYDLVLDSAGFPTTNYSFVGPSSGALAPGATITPTIRFCPAPTAFGVQEARLRMTTTDGEVRVFLLRAIAGAPQGRFALNGVDIIPGSAVFNQINTCVGVEAVTQPLTVENIGTGDLVINELKLYRVDTAYRQGPPQMLRDAQGRLVPAFGYILSDQPGTYPITANTQSTFPIIIPDGQTRTFYITYVGQAPGRGFARAFFRTTAENFTGVDTNQSNPATNTVGLLSFDFIARSVGAKLASDSSGTLLRPLNFPSVRIKDTMMRSVVVYNDGACDLRISKTHLRLFSGDVNEFKIMSAFANTNVDATTDDYVFAPGQSDSIVIRFIPSRSGTRMVTLRLRTNDSTILIPGIGERGAYLLDVQGQGKAGLDPRDLVLPPVLIGSSSTGIAVLENSSTSPVEVSNIFFAGGDAAEFSEATSTPWPARPAIVLPGSKLNLGVRLTPVGIAGDRRTQLNVVTTSNDTFRVNVRGEAGTQELVVSPRSLFDDVFIPVGATARRTIMISNNGTLPIRLASPVLSGPDSANYRMGSLPRLDLAPGATEYLEVTYVPTISGQSSGEIAISAVGGTPMVVTLNGTALRIRKNDDASTQVMTGRNPADVNGGAASSISGIDGNTSSTGVMLSTPKPNPATQTAEIAYAIPTRGDVSIVLYDANGRVVSELFSGVKDAGEHRVTVDVSDLNSGVLHYRMTFGGTAVTRTLVIAR